MCKGSVVAKVLQSLSIQAYSLPCPSENECTLVRVYLTLSCINGSIDIIILLLFHFLFSSSLQDVSGCTEVSLNKKNYGVPDFMAEG